jgi:hypothetical protein
MDAYVVGFAVYIIPKICTVVWRYVSPGLSNVEGNDG